MPRTSTSLTRSLTSSRSGVATSNSRPSAMLRLLQFFGALQGVLYRALHEERLLGDLVVLALGDFAEAADGVREFHVLARHAGELLAHVEGLREELLDLARSGDRKLILIGELVDTEDGDDVLQVLIALQNSFYHLSRLIVIVADDVGV